MVCWAGHVVVAGQRFLGGHGRSWSATRARLGLLAVTGGGDRESVTVAMLFTLGGARLPGRYRARRHAAPAHGGRGGRRRARRGTACVRRKPSPSGCTATARNGTRASTPCRCSPVSAAGVLDPADERVRTRCAVEAGRMRRLFAEQDEVPDPFAARTAGLRGHRGAQGRDRLLGSVRPATRAAPAVRAAR